MTQASLHTSARAIESLLAFWCDAGVDVCLADAPVDRTAEAPRPRKAQIPGSPTAVARRPESAVAPDVSAAVAEARRLAALAQDLDQLREAISGFDGCGLKFEGARQAVFARGAQDAPLAIVGEGPGAEEDQRGEPFVGRAGRLLDQMLKAAGLEGRVFITNTVFWRPPGNRTPSVTEQMVCQPFVERALTLLRPRFLLLVGGPSAKSMLKREEGILSLRGRWFEWRDSSGELVVPALPTLHPAFLLRQPAAKKKAWGDLLTLAERLDRPERPD
jgi:DNA polymerase